jgi:omega-hydroxy-beta-dihydromenaquinone-9 sulfotransferase
MRTGAWLKMLARNRFAISPRRWGLAFMVSLSTPVNSALYWLQRATFGRRIEQTELVADPLFIIGHWRSGTTLLHELLVQDERFAFPDTYACFAPNHFVLSRPLITPWLRFLLPSMRPMDNMRISWERPQEDEFALLALGLPSPYESLAFPNRIPPGLAHFEETGSDAAARQHWQEGLVWFLKCVTYRKPKRVILKSPPHTRRIETLVDVFPNAQFVHIVRDPCALFASTMRLWKSLAFVQGLQVPSDAGLEEAVFAGLEQMYAALAEQKRQVDPANFVSVRYEDLVADPESELRRVYATLRLGGFATYLPRLREYWDGVAGYSADQYDLDPALRRRIADRWGPILAEYGYTV